MVRLRIRGQVQPAGTRCSFCHRDRVSALAYVIRPALATGAALMRLVRSGHAISSKVGFPSPRRSRRCRPAGFAWSPGMQSLAAVVLPP